MDKKIEKARWAGKRRYIITAIAAAVAVAGYSFVFARSRSSLNVKLCHLSLCSVRKGDFQEYVPVDGIVAPGETFYLDVIQGGMVEKIYVEDGSKVNKGDTIAKMTNANLELEYINRETQMFDIMNNLQTSKAALGKNRIDMQRQLAEINYKIEVLRKRNDATTELFKGGAVSRNEYQDTRRELDFLLEQRKLALSVYSLDSIFTTTQMETLGGSIKRMKNNLYAIHRILEQLYVIAPAQGQLSSLNATVGELKKSGDKLGQIDVQDYYRIKVNMDERYVSRVYTGQEAVVEYTGKSHVLKISRILPEVKDGTFSMHLLFEREMPEGIKRGQSLPVKIKFGGVSKALMVQRSAFYQSTGGNWIYVVDEQKKIALKRTIRIGRQNADNYEVLQGLEEGEKVIVSSYKDFGDKDQLNLN